MQVSPVVSMLPNEIVAYIISWLDEDLDSLVQLTLTSKYVREIVRSVVNHGIDSEMLYLRKRNPRIQHNKYTRSGYNACYVIPESRLFVLIHDNYKIQLDKAIKCKVWTGRIDEHGVPLIVNFADATYAHVFYEPRNSNWLDRLSFHVEPIEVYGVVTCTTTIDNTPWHDIKFAIDRACGIVDDWYLSQDDDVNKISYNYPFPYELNMHTATSLKQLYKIRNH